jgi:hypothetical protein
MSGQIGELLACGMSFESVRLSLLSLHELLTLSGAIPIIAACWQCGNPFGPVASSTKCL